ncbi:hypothetical protein COLO4_36931 [Corchorus olitorius]|uniref:Uncharacterized protein n=1 Tax=Corchorus olitorius TaxID=93759 RepID=A0A1R3G435_9ROSI|nr:hypothetical protein COLO4_36931 [Corchorus olitorius]
MWIPGCPFVQMKLCCKRVKQVSWQRESFLVFSIPLTC